MMKSGEPSFVKCYNKLSCLFNPYETRFIQHMVEIEFIKSCGYDTNWSKITCMKRMGLKENTFDKCVRRFVRMKLLYKTFNDSKNKVYYSWNMGLYFKLVRILSITNDVDKLRDFCQVNFIKKNRMIDEISEDEIEILVTPEDKGLYFLGSKLDNRFWGVKNDSKYSGKISAMELLESNSKKLDFIISKLVGEG